MEKVKAIFILILISFQLFAQETSIVLANKKTRNIIEQANVSWQSFNNPSKGGYAVADYKGKIQIPLREGEKIILQATCVGFKSLQDTIVLKSAQNLYMEEDVLNIDQVTVTGTRTPHVLKKAPVLTQLVSQEELKGVDAPNITDILQVEMPGVEMSSHGGTPIMNMMGMESQYSLILVDGERLAKTLQKTIDYSRINTANIERIEIIRGASSALYGSDAIGGVINIITKNANKKVSASADVKYQQSNQKNHTAKDLEMVEDDYAKKFYSNIDKPNLNANLSVGLKHKGFSSLSYFNFKTTDSYNLENTKGNIRYYKNGDVIQRPVIKGKTPVNGFQSYSINQKFGYKNKKWDIKLNGNHYNYNEFDFNNDGFRLLNKSYNATGKASYLINESNSITLSHSMDKYQRFNHNEKKIKNAKTHDNVYNSTKLNYVMLLNKHSVFAEIENLYQTLETDMFEADTMKVKGTNNTVFVLQDEFEPFNNIILIGGIRAGYHSTFKTHFSPSINAKYSIGKQFNLRLTYSRGFRSPDVKELFMDWSHLGMFQIKGNVNLKPETSNYYSFSADFLDISHDLNATFIASYNHIKNKIDGAWSDNQTVFNYVNFSKADIFSLEALLKWQFHKNFKIKTGYIFLATKKSLEAQNLSTMSPMSATAQLEYKMSKGNYRLMANISGKITGKKEIFVLDSKKGSIYEGQIYKIKYPTYAIFNLSVNQYYGNFKLGLGVKNILDYKAPIITFNTTNSPGRRFYVSLGYSF